MIPIKMSFIKKVCIKRLAQEEICDIISNNACWVHYTRTKELPYLKHLLENQVHEPWVIKLAFDRIDRQFNILWKEFNRYKNFIDT